MFCMHMNSLFRVCCCGFRFLGHLYAAEALISLDRISDAIAHLNPENVTDVSLGVSPSEQDQGASLCFSCLHEFPQCPQNKRRLIHPTC